MQLYFEKKLLNNKPELYLYTSYLNLQLLDEPILQFFAYILDVDNIISTSEIYDEVWGKSIKDFMINKILS